MQPELDLGPITLQTFGICFAVAFLASGALVARRLVEIDEPGDWSYELIFCVADPGDPIVPLVERLIAAHPQVPARLILGDERISENPKLNNCLRGWRAAAHDWVVLADSNVAMPPDYLQRLQAAWRADTGLVCSTPAGARPAAPP